MRTEYIEMGNETMRVEYEPVGWSVFDLTIVYKRKTTIFSIADGIISVHYDYVNSDGTTKYKALVYRNFSNGFTYLR